MKKLPHFFISALIIFAILETQGCQIATSQPQPAIIASASQKNLLIITSAISEILHNRKITLSDDAFLKNSELILERRPQSSSSPGYKTGRAMEKANHFRLWLQGNSCILEHIETAEKRLLPELTCISQ